MISELILFIVGTVFFTFLTMSWKSKIKTSLEQIQKNALICGTLISVFQLILLFAEFESILKSVNLSTGTIPKEYTSLSSFFMMIFVKLRPIFFGICTKLILQLFIQKKDLISCFYSFLLLYNTAQSLSMTFQNFRHSAKFKRIDSIKTETLSVLFESEWRTNHDPGQNRFDPCRNRRAELGRHRTVRL